MFLCKTRTPPEIAKGRKASCILQSGHKDRHEDVFGVTWSTWFLDSQKFLTKRPRKPPPTARISKKTIDRVFDNIKPGEKA